MKSESKLREQLQGCLDRNDIRKKLVKRSIEEKEPIENFGPFHRQKSWDTRIGMYQLPLGRIEAARSSFAEAAGYGVAMLYWLAEQHEQGMDTGGHWPAYMSEAEDVLNLAMLSGDQTLQQRAVARTLAVRDEFEDSMPYVTGRAIALVGFISEDEPLITDGCELIENADLEDREEHRAYREHTLDLFRGLLQNDPVCVEAAVEWFAAEHERDFEEDWSGMLTYARHGIVGVELARRRGMDVRVEAHSIPDALYQDEWQHQTEQDVSDLVQRVLKQVDEHIASH
jgi:hypothetical protein